MLEKLFGSTESVHKEIIAAGISADQRGDAFRCCNCLKMREGFLYWVDGSVVIGDPLWSVMDKQQSGRYNGHSSGWCVSCAAKLLQNKEPRKGPPPEPPKPRIRPKMVECGKTRFTQSSCPEGGGFVATLATEAGRKLLSQWDEYHELARSGQSSYNEKEIAIKACGLLLLDLLSERKATESEGR